ncbi:MAG TPA: PQQ-binding-like beta-propeller repeat protein, partial [Lacipirellulaceae bacterium]|nr:PQQ-binding-like beta-propeller repeat protein [Lacipirellulaceae bacterium]
LGGRAASGAFTVREPLAEMIVARPDVETFRASQLTSLLAGAKSDRITLLLPSKELLSEKQVAALSAALESRGIALAVNSPLDKPLPSEPQRGLFLTAGIAGSNMGPLLNNARDGGLAPLLISRNVPGAGRGFITPLYAPRGYGENAIALVGGDAAGLGKTVDTFCEQLAKEDFAAPEAIRDSDKIPEPGVVINCEPDAKAASLPRLADMVGPRLSRIATSNNSPNIAVAATGFGKNLAVVKDLGTSGQLVFAKRIGASETNDSLFVSPDGRYAGLSARELTRCGEAFHLVDANDQSEQIFAAFGDMASRHHHFAASSDGKFVLAVGTYGVVCWKRGAGEWKEAWADDYWKSFNKLSWPISDTDERIPTFHAYIPEGANYALVVFSETGDNGWVTPDHHYKASLAAYNLADGRKRWQFDIPIPDAQLFPTLYASPDGRHLLVKIQNGSWNAVSYAFYLLNPDSGAQGASWTKQASPQVIAVGNDAGMIAQLFSGRQLELRANDGSVKFDQLWSGADPVSLVFSSDGRELYVADDADRLSCISLDGELKWQVAVGAVSQLAVSGSRIYAAGWDGRVRAVSAEGKLLWTLDCTPGMDSVDPLGEIVRAGENSRAAVCAAERPSTSTAETPPGQDLVAAGLVNFSGEKVEGDAIEALRNRKATKSEKPLVSINQLRQDMLTGQQAQIILEFAKPTDVGTLTVRENRHHPEAYPTDSFIGVWNESNKRWETAKRGVFLRGPVNTYALNLKGVTKLLYCPWNSYGHNFYTTHIEVRLPDAKDGYQQNFDRLAAGPISGQDFWKADPRDRVVANPSGGQMLKVLKGAERPMAFNTDPAFTKQSVSFDFMFNRTINDPTFAVSSGVRQLFHGFTLCGPDPEQTFRFGYEGARNPKEAWINSLRLGNTSSPNTILPHVWYRAEITLDRQAGSFDFKVTEKDTGKLYWHPNPTPCGKWRPDGRGMNVIQFNAQDHESDEGGFFIDNIELRPVKTTSAK